MGVDARDHSVPCGEISCTKPSSWKRSTSATAGRRWPAPISSGQPAGASPHHRGGPGAQSRAHPDGTRIAFIWDRADLSDVYVMPPPVAGRDVSTHRALTAYWSDEVPRWSPDGAWLAFTMDDHVHVAPAGGGEPRKIATLRPRRPRRCGCPTAGASSSAWNRTTAPSWC
ncbi:MAG: hypothetical protein R2854_03005 [Caldilineaceae bacterium]